MSLWLYIDFHSQTDAPALTEHTTATGLALDHPRPMAVSFAGVAQWTSRVRLHPKPSCRWNHTCTVDARSTRLRQARIMVNRAVVLARLAVHTPVRRLLSKLVQCTRALVCPSCNGRINAGGIGTGATVLARVRCTSTSTNHFWTRSRSVACLYSHVGKLKLRQHDVHGHLKTGGYQTLRI